MRIDCEQRCIDHLVARFTVLGRRYWRIRSTQNGDGEKLQKLTPFFLSFSVNRVWVDEGYLVRKLAPFVVDLCLVLLYAVAVPRVFIHFCGCVMQVSISATLLSSFYFAERFEIKVGRSK